MADTTATIMSRTCSLVGHRDISPGVGGTEPATYYRAVATALGIDTRDENGKMLSKPRLAARIVETAGLTWDPVWEGAGKKAGGSVSNAGLLAIESAAKILLGIATPPAAATATAGSPTPAPLGASLGVVAAQIVQRQQLERLQAGPFRAGVLAAYGGRCAITGCDLSAVLDAAHIDPYSASLNNALSNGIALRRDIHRLFDSHLLLIEPKTWVVWLDPAILWPSDYQSLAGQPANLPTTPAVDPRPALEEVWRDFGP